MAFALWELCDLPVDPAGPPLADCPRLVGDIPTLFRGIPLAMPCVGLDDWSSAMAYIKWPGPYIVKYAFDIALEVARSCPGAAHEQVTDILVDQG